MIAECHDNYFGKMCNQTCHCKDGALCNKDKGQCPEDECEAGYKGVDCQEGKILLFVLELYTVQCK